MKSQPDAFTFELDQMILEERREIDIARSMETIFSDIGKKVTSHFNGTNTLDNISLEIKPTLKYKTSSHETWSFRITVRFTSSS